MAESYAAKLLDNPKAAGVPGVLTVTQNSFKWVPNNPNAAATLSVDMKSIKNQRSSKEGTSKKAMLNLLTDNAAVQYFFEFKNFGDRDNCKNFFIRLLSGGTAPAPASAANQASSSSTNQASSSRPQTEQLNTSEVERRVKLLAENRELQMLHQKLVRGGLLSEAEFWASRKGIGAAPKKQKTGMESVMMALAGNADGQTSTVKVKLSKEIIYQIFTEKPAVHRAFLNFVPSKMTEEEFWKKYCRAQLLIKENEAAARAEADIDEDYQAFINEDDIVAKEFSRKAKRVDPTLDMISDAADELPLPAHVNVENAGKTSRLARELNRHAAVVLEGRLLDVEDGMQDRAIAQDLARVQLQQQDTPMEIDDNQRTERVRQMTELEDLQGHQGPAPLPLSIQDPRKYFNMQSRSNLGDAGSSAQDPDTALQRYRQQIEHCQTSGLQIPTSLADRVFNDLTQSISNAKHPLGRTAEKNVLDVLPASVKERVLQHSATINELLRHFWATYPITSRALAEKADRLKDVMVKIYTELENLKKSMSEHRHQVSLVLQPMLQTLDEAIAHHESEAKKRSSRKQGNGLEQQHTNGIAVQ